jgi:hypothetical protein
VLNVHYIYELPFWREQDSFVKKALGGWQIAGVNYYQSGAPFWIGTSNDRAGVGDTIRQPWDLVGDPNVAQPGFSNGAGNDAVFWFNGQAFRQPAAGTFGNMARNSLRGPSSWGWDLSLIKNIQLNAKDQRLQLRVEAFNVLNHPNLNDPSNDPLSGSFGRVTAKTGNRAVQLGVKFIF